MPRSAKKSRGQTPAAVAPHNTGAPTQAITAPTGLDYGAHKALTDAQHAVPLPADGAPAAPPDALGAAQQHIAQPVGLVSPSSRPEEPVTAGLSTGPGPGPSALGPSASGGAFPADPAAFLRSIYQIAPNPDLADLIHHFQGY